MTKTDEDTIREIELQFNEAWGRHDANGMVASLSDDAQFVTVNGAWTKTRADYLELMTRLHGPNGPFRTSTRETPIMHVRFLAPDVAMMHSEFHIYGDVDEPALALVSYVRSMGVGGPLLCKILTCAGVVGTKFAAKTICKRYAPSRARLANRRTSPAVKSVRTAIAWPMANDSPFATLNHSAGDL